MAFGTLAFDTLQTSDSKKTGTSQTLDTSYVYNGSAKAHVSCELVGDAAIEGSFNIASLTDSGTGKATPTYTTNFSAATYSVTSGGGLNGDIVFTEHAGRSLCTTSNLRIHTRAGDETLVDGDLLSAALFGDLA
jgi:hypothetical protein